MAEAVVIGAGVGGLGSALALARSGHRVTVVERDAVPMADSPDAAFDHWRRRGAPQTRHSHAFLARLRNLLRDRFPDVLADVLAAGAAEIDFTRHPPPALDPLDREPGDEDLVGVACRRTTFEWVLRRCALATPDVTIVPGEVTGLVADGVSAGLPHVGGVGLGGGAVLLADLVVDAGGLRSPLPRWLAEIGAGPVPESVGDTGIVYSSRFYRVADPAYDPAAHGLVVGDLGYLKYAVFPGDNGTLSITFGLHADDTELRRLLRPGPFTAVAAELAATRPWVEPGRCQPISDVEVMGGLVNRRRRFSVDGRPVATGVYAVGDSSICTNPLYGRGCSLAMAHAVLLADTLAAAGDDPEEAALAFADATRTVIEPWYGAAVAQDGHDRRAAGEPDDDGESGMGVGSLMRHGLLPAAGADPLVWRAFIRMFNLLALPDAMMRDPEVVRRVLDAWQGRGDRPPPPRLGPDRDELLQRLTGAA
ncbi:MAG TPA: FAD-dependent oxidoreductase, partial [Acidimicrobiales bacterium]|nr:FAD-dependent oxidoreductase [Acidimicrobiales bacterium]